MNEYKIRRVFWGDRTGVVIHREKWTESEKHHDNYLYYEGKIFDRQCSLEYYFDGLQYLVNGRLRQITYRFKKQEPATDKILYRNLKKILTEKYGAPLESRLDDRICWLAHEMKTHITLTDNAGDGPNDIVVCMDNNIQKDGSFIITDPLKQALLEF